MDFQYFSFHITFDQPNCSVFTTFNNNSGMSSILYKFFRDNAKGGTLRYEIDVS